MRRVLAGVVVGLVVAAGLVSPSEAATRRQPPSAPRQVAVSTQGQPSGSARVSWAVPRSAGSSAVEAYAVTVAPVGSGAAPVWSVVPAARRSMVLKGLASDARYTVRVAAYNRWGRGPWARASLRTPHVPTVFALDPQAHTLVHVDPSGRSAPAVVLRGLGEVTDLEVDRAGNAYVAADGSVQEVPAHGRPVVLGAGTQVETDASGAVYLASSSGVVKISPSGRRSTVTSASGGTLLVDAAGTVTLAAASGPQASSLVLTTYRTGTAPVVRTVSNFGHPGTVLEDGHGTVYVLTYAGGGSGFSGWIRVAAGSSAWTRLGTRLAEYGLALGPDDTVSLAQSALWCSNPAEGTGHCTPDLRVVDIARYAADGHLLGTVPVSGLVARERAGIPLAVDSTGTTWATDRGASPALVRIPAAGGAATPVLAGDLTPLAAG